MNYWLVKADPETDYSIDDLARDGSTEWTGVHNNAAILHIQKMKPGDLVYVYHSQKEKSIVGLAEVSGEPYENTADPRRSWALQLTFEAKYDKPLQLAVIKAAPECTDFALVRIGRLSVMPVAEKVQKWLNSKLETVN
jgi:predicted RNA-binding protein with PUA-like domain